MPRFAANLSMMFQDVPFPQRFAAAAECTLFAFLVDRWEWRDMGAIVAANLASFAAGEVWFQW